MPHYKDTENKLHWLDDTAFEYMLPPGSVQITEEEAQALIPAPVVSVPDTITMRQCRLQLLADGDLANVTQLINAAGEAAQIEWEYGSQVKRDNVLFQTIAGALGKDEAAQDLFFTEASKL